jgi:hypothetical protein
LLQDPAVGGTEWIEVTKVISAILLPLIGIAVVLFSMFAFYRPFGLPLKEKTQRLRGFGLDLEISVLTLFVLIGLTFCLTGFYLLTRDYESKIEELSGLKEDLRRAEKDFAVALRQAKQFDVTAFITLDSAADQGMPRPDQLECKLLLFGGGSQPRKLAVEAGIVESQYRVVVENLTESMQIRMLQCQDTSTRRRWTLETFNPLEPEYRLERQR